MKKSILITIIIILLILTGCIKKTITLESNTWTKIVNQEWRSDENFAGDGFYLNF